MAREPMQDMIPPEKRTIRRIHIDRTKRVRRALSPTMQDEVPPAEEDLSVGEPESPHNTLPPEPPLIPKKRRSWLKWLGGILGVVVVAVLLLSFVFSGARVSVAPVQEGVRIDGQFEALRNGEPGDLPFETMSLSKTLTKEVEATGETFVDRKASGKIIIYNDFDENEQRLIKNTRFETPTGLIYRIDDSVVVPGQHEDESGKVVPGTIEVTVFADTSGEEYNIGLTDFTVPGFEGDPRFDKFYARSKTPMEGGFSGLEKTVSPEAEEIARAALEGELTEALRAEAIEQIPDGFILYDNASFFSFRSLPNKAGEKSESVLLQEEATFYGVLFDKEKLAQHVATQTVASYEGGPVELLHPEMLEFTIVDRDLFEPASAGSVDFTLSGNDTLVWLFDMTQLTEDLAGKHRREVSTVFSGYPAIDEAEISLRPFWKRHFPDDPQKIKVERVIADESTES